MYTETLTLANGVKIPQLGLGTWFIDDANAAEAVKAAAKLGYRHFDTAQAYGNERGVGEGVRSCGVAREELFVVSKVAAEHKTYEAAKASIDATLQKMGLDYLDMMIIHSPQPWDKVNQCEDRYVEGNRAAWRALEEAYKEGKLRAIGVSNFQIGDLNSLLEGCTVKPMVNQILLHISNTPLELVEFCQNNGIAVEAYSPIAHGEILHQPEIQAMAEKYGVAVPQLCIRYTLQLELSRCPRLRTPPTWRRMPPWTLPSVPRTWRTSSASSTLRATVQAAASRCTEENCNEQALYHLPYDDLHRRPQGDALGVRRAHHGAPADPPAPDRRAAV